MNDTFKKETVIFKFLFFFKFLYRNKAEKFQWNNKHFTPSIGIFQLRRKVLFTLNLT